MNQQFYLLIYYDTEMYPEPALIGSREDIIKYLVQRSREMTPSISDIELYRHYISVFNVSHRIKSISHVLQYENVPSLIKIYKCEHLTPGIDTGFLIYEL